VCKEFLILFVRFGRLVAQEKVLLDDALSLLPILNAVFFNGETAPAECKKEEIDDMQILSSWIYHNRQTLSFLYVQADHSPESLMTETLERLCKLSNYSAIELESEPADDAAEHASN
jgi:DNA polymerase-3 subunit epsilon